MDLIILEGLDITINLAEIAMLKAIKIDNPTYIPAIPSKEIKEVGGVTYFERTEITLRCGEKMLVELPYSDFILVVKKWMSVSGGMKEETKGTKDGSGKVGKSKK